MSEPKEMKTVFFTPKRNQIMIDNMVAAVWNFFVKNRGLDKLVIEVRDCEQLNKKEATIQKLTKALEYYANADHWSGWEEENGFLWCNTLTPDNQDYENLEGTVMSGGKLARAVLKEVRPEPIVIYDEDINIFDEGDRDEV